MRQKTPLVTLLAALFVLALAWGGCDGKRRTENTRPDAAVSHHPEATAAHLGVQTRVGRVHVWGEFQINDWNDVGECRTTTSRSDTAPVPGTTVGTAALTSENGSSPFSPIGDVLTRDLDETVSLELGASFPSDRAMGSVRYQRVSDGASISAPAERERLGIEGQVALQNHVTFRAGYEKISTSGPVEQEESNIWTGIEIRF